MMPPAPLFTTEQPGPSPPSGRTGRPSAVRGHGDTVHGLRDWPALASGWPETGALQLRATRTASQRIDASWGILERLSTSRPGSNVTTRHAACYFNASMGRPSKLDDLTAQKVINAVAKGLPRDTAARLASISPTTLYRALRLGREGEPEYAEFAQRVAAAEAAGEVEIVGMLRGHAANSWQACAWLLERRHPKAWALKKLEAQGVAVTIEEAEKLAADLKALAK